MGMFADIVAPKKKTGGMFADIIDKRTDTAEPEPPYVPQSQTVIKPTDQSVQIQPKKTGGMFAGILNRPEPAPVVTPQDQSWRLDESGRGQIRTDAAAIPTVSQGQSRDSILTRAGKQYANKTVLEDIERNRPSSATLESVGTMQGAFESLKDLPENPTFWQGVKSIPKIWWAITKSYYSPTKRGEREVAHAALKELRPDMDFDVPPPATIGEKAVDVGAGVGAFVTRLLATKKLLPKDMMLSDAAAWEILNSAEGGIPGQGAATQGTLGLIGGIPTKTAIGGTAKVLGEGAVFGGMTAAEGGSTEDVIVATLLPAVLKGLKMAPGKIGETELGHTVVKKFSGKFPETADVIRAKPSPEAVAVTEQVARQMGYDPETATSTEKAAVNIVAREVEWQTKQAQKAGGKPTVTPEERKAPQNALTAPTANDVSGTTQTIAKPGTPPNLAAQVAKSVENQGQALTPITEAASRPVETSGKSEWDKGQQVRNELLAKVRELEKQRGYYTIEDVTPEGYGPTAGETETITPKLEMLPSETEDQAMARVVGYGIDNGTVKLEETPDAWKARVLIVGDFERPRVFYGLTKQSVIKQAYEALNPAYEVPVGTKKVESPPSDQSGGVTEVSPTGKALIADVPGVQTVSESSGKAAPVIKESLTVEQADPLIQEARKYKTAEEFVKKIANDAGVSNRAKVKEIPLNKISGTDYPELDAALKSGKLSAQTANDLIGREEQITQGKKIITPISVGVNPDGSYYLLGGNNRVAQALVNGQKTINAISADFKDGKQLADIWNKAQAKPIGASEETQPVVPAKGTSETTNLNLETIPEQEIPLDKLKFSKDVPQFKEDADPETGIVKGQQLSGKYTRFGKPPIVVWQRLNGDLEIITGRHRFDLAKRSGEKTIKGQIVKESEGFTAKNALIFDAESNIQDEQGTVKDYAHYFRNIQITEKEARQRGLLQRSKGPIGWRIGKDATDGVYNAYVNGQLSEAKADAIAKGAPNNEAVQMAALVSAKKKTADELEIFSRILARTKPTKQTKQGGLFDDFDDSALSQAEDVAQEVKKELIYLKDRILSVSGALRRPETAREMGLKFSDKDSIEKEVERLKAREESLYHVDTNPKLYNEMLKRAGYDVSESGLETGKTNLFGEKTNEPPKTIQQQTIPFEESSKLVKEIEDKPLIEDVPGQKKMFGGRGGNLGSPATRGIKVSMEASQQPITARSILDQMSRDFKVPIRGKATHQMRTVLGFYSTKARGIRLKEALSIGTATHEVAHHLDWYINNRLSKDPPSGTADELVKLGRELYGKRKPSIGGYRSEGFAEFIRYELTSDEGAREKTPNFYKFWTEEYLPKHPQEAKSLAKAKKMIDQWRFQGAEARVESQINRKELKGTLKERVKRTALKIESEMRDRLAPLRRQLEAAGIELDPFEEGGLRPSQNPVELAVKYSEKESGIARGFVLLHTTDAWGTPNGKCLAEIVESVADSFKEFTRYAYARAALERWKQGKNPGISKDDAQFVFDKYDGEEWRQISDEITAWNHRVIDYGVQAGAISEKLANLIKAKNPVYIPMLRAFAPGELAGKQGGGGKNYVDTGKAIKAMKGSGREIIDPFESMITQAHRIISISNKTMVAKAVADLAEHHQGLAGVIWKVPPPIKTTKVDTQDTIQKLMDLGVDIGDIPENLPTELFYFSTDTKYWGKDNIVPIIKEGGKPEFYEVSPELYRILKGLDVYHLPKFLNATLGKASRGVRLGATGLNPAFGLIRNFLKDAGTAVLTAKHAKWGPFSSIKGVALDVADADIARLFKGMGGQMSGAIGYDRILTQKLTSEMTARSGKRYAIHTVFHPVTALRELFGVSELGPRIAEFNKALEYGEKHWGKGSPDALVYAFNAAQDVTINFTRGGDAARMLNQAIPFFNASIQGPDKHWRVAVKNPIAYTLKGIALFTIPTLLLWLYNRDEEWYKNLTIQERADYWHFRIPGTDTIIRLPKPFESGYIFASIPESVVDKQYNDNPDEISDTLIHALKRTLPGVVPAIATPLLEVYGNKNWQGIPIIPRGLENKLPEDQSKPYTTALMKLIGKQLKISPAQLEHITNGYTGGLYGRVASTLGDIKKVATGDIQPLTKSDWPVIGTLFLNEPDSPRAQVERFYQERDRLTRLNGSDKITTQDNQKRLRLDATARQLSPLWKKLQQTTNPEQRNLIYSQIKRIVESEVTPSPTYRFTRPQRPARRSSQ